MADRFSPEVTAAALKKLDDLPRQEVQIGGVATSSGDVGVEGSVNLDVGKPGGWSLAGEGSWMRRAGASVAGMFRWRGKS